MIAAAARLLERGGQLPARPVFRAFNLSGVVATVGAFLHRPLDPHYRLVLAASPAALIAVVCITVAIVAVRRGL